VRGAFCWSIVACARNGTSYSLRSFAAPRTPLPNRFPFVQRTQAFRPFASSVTDPPALLNSELPVVHISSSITSDLLFAFPPLAVHLFGNPALLLPQVWIHIFHARNCFRFCRHSKLVHFFRRDRNVPKPHKTIPLPHVDPVLRPGCRLLCPGVSSRWPILAKLCEIVIHFVLNSPVDWGRFLLLAAFRPVFFCLTLLRLVENGSKVMHDPSTNISVGGTTFQL